MELIFLRHGQTDGNTEHRFQLMTQPLNSKGLEQVRTAAGMLSGVHFDAVFSGRALRIRQTRLAVLEVMRHVPARVRETSSLDEIRFGILAGLTFEEAEARYPDVAREYLGSWPEFTFPHGHRFTSFYARSADFLNRVLKLPLRRALLIGSEGPIMAMINAARGRSPERMFETKVANAQPLMVEVPAHGGRKGAEPSAC